MFKPYSILDLLCSSQQMDADSPYFLRPIKPQLFESYAGESSIDFPLPDSAPLEEQVMFLLIIFDFHLFQ